MEFAQGRDITGGLLSGRSASQSRHAELIVGNLQKVFFTFVIDINTHGLWYVDFRQVLNQYEVTDQVSWR